MSGPVKAVCCGACLIAALLAVYAITPRTRDTGGCLFCGRTRDEAWWCGIKVRDQIHEGEASAWVDQLHPNHTNHLWGISSHSHKDWFAGTMIGCGGVGASGVANIHYLKSQVGEARATELLHLYHFQVQTNRAGLAEFLRLELATLVTNTNATTPSPR
jgi:hypothetical protein